MKELESRGKSDHRDRVGAADKGDGRTSIEGVMAEYMEWNTKYVQAVHSFVSAIKWIPGVPEIPDKPPGNGGE